MPATYPAPTVTRKRATQCWFEAFACTGSSRILSGGCVTVASRSSSTPSLSVIRSMVTVRGAAASAGEPAGVAFPVAPTNRLGSIWSCPSVVRSAE